MKPTGLQAQLQEVEASIEQARERRAVATRKLEQAKTKVAQAKTPSNHLHDDPAFKEAAAAVKERDAAHAELEQLQLTQAGILRMLGKDTPRPGGPNGSTDDARATAGDGWARAAQAFDIKGGVLRGELPAGSLMRPMAMAGVDIKPSPTDLTQPAVTAPFFQSGQDRRYLYPVFGRQQLDPGDVAVQDYRQHGVRRAATIEADDDLVTSADHGYSAGDPVVFVALTGGAPLEVGTTYYVMAAGLTADAFKVAATPGGVGVDVTADATAATVINTKTLGRTVTGEVERDPMASTEKAQLGIGIEYVNTKVRQFALVCPDIPDKLFDVVPALTAFLRSEMMYQLERSLDSHVVAQILDAAPLSGSVGPDLISQTRHAIAALHDVGANPSVLAVSPTAAADLDLTQVGADDLYLFLTRETGSASPLFRLRIAEVPGLAAPIVIDPAELGVLYAGTAKLQANPFGEGFRADLVDVRAEVEALLHIRDASGAYVIA